MRTNDGRLVSDPDVQLSGPKNTAQAQIERTHSRVHCPQSLFRSVFHRETYEDK